MTDDRRFQVLGADREWIESFEWSIEGARAVADTSDGTRVLTSLHDSIVLVPVFCPVCELPMRTDADDESYQSWSCCSFCEIHWARPRRDDWNMGWRPDRNEIERKIEHRLSLFAGPIDLPDYLR